MLNPADVHIRVIDQRIGAGIGGRDTVIRALHVPTGLLVEVPRISGSQFYDREIALEMLTAALTHPRARVDTMERKHGQCIRTPTTGQA